MDAFSQKCQKGQAALIALLVLTIATTVGLSLIGRSTTDLSITRNLEESARAFSAAEAGVENALRTGVATTVPLDQSTGTTYNVTVASVSANANTSLVLPSKTLPETTETIWLTNHKGDGSIDDTVPLYTASSIDVCWSAETVTPALIASLLYKYRDGSYRVAKGAYDPDNTRASTDKFSAPTAISGGCGNSTNTTYKQTITFASFTPAIDPTQDVLIALRLRLAYSGGQLAVNPAQALPFQGNQIVSVGKTAGGTNRKIVVYQEYKSPSSLFDAAIFSQGSFSH